MSILQRLVVQSQLKRLPLLVQANSLHGSSTVMKNKLNPLEKTHTWLDENDDIYPPQKPWEERRPAWVCHMRSQIKYAPKKMHLIALMVRGMAVDDAINKLAHVPLKGAQIMKEVIEEAQELAVKEHNVEYKSNLWIAESKVDKGIYVKGLRRHARCRFGKVTYYYCDYFVRLLEGQPPVNFHGIKDGNQKLEEYLAKLRSRMITRSL